MTRFKSHSLLLLPVLLFLILQGTISAQTEYTATAGMPVPLERDGESPGTIRPTPRSAESVNNAGCVYMDAGQYEKALAEFKLAISLKPQLSEAHNNLGTVYVHLGRHKEAFKAILEAVRLNPANVTALNNLGVVQINAKQYDAAIKTLSRAVELNPRFAQAQYNLGLIYASRKDKRAALGLHATLKQLDAELGRKLFGEIHRDKILDVGQK